MKLAGCFNGPNTTYMPKIKTNLISHDPLKFQCDFAQSCHFTFENIEHMSATDRLSFPCSYMEKAKAISI